MAKILTEPKDSPEIWKKTVTCSGKGWDQEIGINPCYRLLEVDATNIYKRSYTYLDGTHELFYGVICPICRAFTEINKNDIPEDVMKAARTYSERPKRDT